MAKFIMRVPNVYDAVAVSDETAISEFSESLTEQDGKDDADINILLKRFGVTGAFPQPGSIPLVTNGDFVDSMDCAEAMGIIRKATESFMELPAEVRAEFNHDPAKFVDYCTPVADERENEYRLDKLRKWGIAVAPEVVVEAPPMRVEVVNQVDSAPPKA